MLTTQAAQRSVTILIVEDDEDILFGIEEIIKSTALIIDEIRYDVRTVTASDGLAGLKQLETKIPDLIISDVMMPHFSGYQLLEEIQTHPEWLHIPFIFLTAKSADEDRHKGKLQGANLYLTKPFDALSLSEHIEAQLKKSFDLRDAQEQYIAALKRKILKVLNHEFRTPLTYVISYFEMLVYQANSAENSLEDYQEYLRGIQAGCVRLFRLVEDFMMVIELKSGEAEMRFQDEAEIIADLPQLIHESIKDNQAQISRAGVQVELDLPEELPGIFGIRPYVVTIFSRIIDNAIKFSLNLNTPPTVTIRAFAAEDEVHVLIRDNGLGMPAFVVDHIFELFYQYNRDSKEQQGAGVGLTITSGLAKIHRARIVVETEEASGTQFAIIFPKNDSLSKQNTDDCRQKRATVLILEDDPNLLDGLQDLLDTIECNYELDILKARNGLEGLDVLKEKLPDLIISDIMMPKMTGYDFLQEVRKIPEWLHIPIIFLTAKGKMPDKHKAFILGVDEYITKPYESDILISYVESQLDRRFKLQKMLDKNFDTLTRSILNLITPNFRQPLSFVNKYVDNFTDSLQDAQTVIELKDSLQGIQTGSEWLHRKIEDFMLLAEIRTGEAEIVFEMHAQKIPNIGVLLSEFSQMYAQKLKTSGIKLKLKPMDTQIAPVFGNLAQISTSISRLIKIGVAQCKLAQDEITVVLSVIDQEAEILLKIQIEDDISNDIVLAMDEIIKANRDNVIDAESFQTYEFAPDLCIVHGYIELQQGWIGVQKIDNSRFLYTIGLPKLIE